MTRYFLAIAAVAILSACESEPMQGITTTICPKPACKAEGFCTADGNFCVAGSVAECRQSAACRNEGRCDLDDGMCVAQTPIP